jgi:hypothetical protein
MKVGQNHPHLQNLYPWWGMEKSHFSAYVQEKDAE